MPDLGGLPFGLWVGYDDLAKVWSDFRWQYEIISRRGPGVLRVSAVVRSRVCVRKRKHVRCFVQTPMGSVQFRNRLIVCDNHTQTLTGFAYAVQSGGDNTTDPTAVNTAGMFSKYLD